MKWFSLIVAVASVFMMACEKKNPDEGSDIATTPNTQCLRTGFCDYDYGQYSGFAPYRLGPNGRYYDYDMNFQNGFCSCDGGYRPVYNNSYGLGCVQNNYLQQYAYDYMAYSWDTQRFQFSQQGFYNYNTLYYPQNNCYNQVLFTCDPRYSGSCMDGGFCQAVSGNMGICVSNTGYYY